MQFQPELLDIVRKNATLDGKLYGLPYLWGTDGLVVNTKRATHQPTTPICAGPISRARPRCACGARP